MAAKVLIFFDIQSHVANNCQIIGIQPPESQDSSGHINIIFQYPGKLCKRPTPESQEPQYQKSESHWVQCHYCLVHHKLVRQE